jgi:hypothetical protein
VIIAQEGGHFSALCVLNGMCCQLLLFTLTLMLLTLSLLLLLLLCYYKQAETAVAALEETASTLTAQLEAAEDEVFADFCASIGVSRCTYS